MNIKILQWNILYKEKVSEVIKTLKKINADIACLQEITTRSPLHPGINTVARIAKELKLHPAFHHVQTWAYPGGRSIQGNAIFSRFPIAAERSLLLQKGPNATPPNRFNENHGYLEVTVKAGGKIIRVGTTHLAFSPFFKGDLKRPDAKKLLRAIRGRKNRFILTGDFNASPNSKTIKGVGEILKNAGPSFREKTWTTKPFSWLGFNENKLRWRLDYIFTTPDIVVKRSRVIKTSASDHLPVLAEIII